MFALREHIAVVLSVLKRMFIASRLTSSDRLKQPVFASVSTLVRELATDTSLLVSFPSVLALIRRQSFVLPERLVHFVLGKGISD